MAGINLLINKDELPDNQSVQCSNCSNVIQYFIPGQSIRLACPKCITLFRLENAKLSKLKVYSFNLKPIIPIGTVCTIKDAKYKLVGFLYCKEYKYKYYWKEYIFFNPLYGYLTLNEYEGHWNLIEQTDYYPRHGKQSVIVSKKEYQIFHKYRSQVVFAIGEFHWDLHESMHPYCTEYIHPPYALIEEKGKDSIAWYHATYLSTTDVKKILKVSILPHKTGVASNQPLSYGFSKDSFTVIRNLSIVLLLVTQLLFMLSSSGKRVFHMDYTFPIDSNGTVTNQETVISQPFQVYGGIFNTVNMEFEMYSPVDNNWTAVSISLINEDTGHEFTFEHVVEYYHGHSGGENWSEGKQKDSKVISKIPAGKYHLNLLPYCDPRSNEPGYFSLSIYEDVIVWSNFFATLACILIIPLLLYIRVQSFESKRWINSEFHD